MNQKIINGKQYSMFENPQTKLDTVKKDIAAELMIIKQKYDKNELSEMPRKLNYNATITQSLFISFSQWQNVPYNDAIQIDAETLSAYISAYMELLKYIKGFYPEFIGSKALFTSFIGISSAAYFSLLTEPTDPDVGAEIDILNDKLCELEFVSAQSGLSKDKVTVSKLKADRVGYNLNMAPEFANSTVTNNTILLTEANIARRLEGIMGALPGKKRNKNQ